MATWNKLDRTHTPTMAEIDAWMTTPLWKQICDHMEEVYKSKPLLEYSGCIPEGWNVKYRKAGRGLCTLYPMGDYFIALVVISAREKTEMELALPTMGAYLQNLYRTTKEGNDQRWLMIKVGSFNCDEVTNREILDDALRCIAIRRGSK